MLYILIQKALLPRICDRYLFRKIQKKQKITLTQASTTIFFFCKVIRIQSLSLRGSTYYLRKSKPHQKYKGIKRYFVFLNRHQQLKIQPFQQKYHLLYFINCIIAIWCNTKLINLQCQQNEKY
ncbi:hypothetical protein TTHERM_001169389 (macronuclear) [Tetrahymena thermophila SB210]|uniref:Uncharacterized protein n=1 Tax=Tetrahymena thermophila (strain SB210) TaxID=312017 RepID=W7XA24_TETTS|nr:hypothetical protein TTHERM_001169389 [Tetrahymena thermophila SB210]EWS74177.1 hypothetical protein TTHERM_001169389 [Tetrahymena thermophila SB210]|eukprot:XP_012653284.1 hypothetical protein TTHERM_001169389 [Tetrahymena thermophila SB210]